MKTCPKCGNTFENTVGFCPRDGEVLQESATNMVGQVLDGQYEVEAFIAQGGMGAVYRARHILLGDRVVIKTLKSEMRNNSEWLRRFQREGQAARRFRHPNSVTVYDLRTASDGMIYMVMEFVEGHSLDKEMRARGRFSPPEALEVLEPVADVLDAAHAVGVVHRDLKPENVMIGAASEGSRPFVKLLDLGIAKMMGVGDAHAGEATSLTVAGQLLGTPYYMSPEQWGELPRDGGAGVDGRTDVYSLALIFYEMVAGRKPFDAQTLADLRRKHVSTPPPLLHEIAPEVPEGFGLAIARALSKDRGDRHTTAGELVNEMRAALGLPPVARSSAASTSSLRHQTSTSGRLGSDTAAGPAGRGTDTANRPPQPTSAQIVPPPEARSGGPTTTNAGGTMVMPADVASRQPRTGALHGSNTEASAPRHETNPNAGRPQ
ncbi:MAG: serine/threonine protein kinase, partial [Pyrinomonadaceae bacterium]